MTKWEDVLPPRVAQAQNAWERRLSIWRARRYAGLTYVAIANWLGVCPQLACQLAQRADRELTKGALSPAERYLADDSEIKGLLEAAVEAPLTSAEIAERLRDFGRRKEEDKRWNRC